MGRGERRGRRTEAPEGGEEGGGRKREVGKGGEGRVEGREGGEGEEGCQSPEHTCAFNRHTWADGGYGVSGTGEQVVGATSA